MQHSILLYAPARCLPNPKFRDLLLDTLQEVVAHSHVSINTVHTTGRVSSFGRGFAEQRIAEAWAASMSPDQDVIQKRAFVQLGQAVVVNWNDPELQSPQLRAVREFLLRFDVRHGMALALSIQGVYGSTLIHLGRRALERPFTDDEASALTAAAPHLIEALMVNRLRANATRSAQDMTDAPVALATLDRWLVYPNAAFAAAWGAMAKMDTGLQVPRIPQEWLDGDATPESALIKKGWQIVSAAVDDGLRIELLHLKQCAIDGKLTRREKEVAQLYGSGYTSKDIGRLLAMSPNTVRVHVGRIFEKLSINSRAVLRTMLLGEDRFGSQSCAARCGAPGRVFEGLRFPLASVCPLRTTQWMSRPTPSKPTNPRPDAERVTDAT